MLTTIQFNFALDKGRLEVLLEADVEHDDRGILFRVNNFHVPGKSSTILPEIKIKKIDGHWVHGDSGWQTELSEVVGKAIEKALAACGSGAIRKPQRNGKAHAATAGGQTNGLGIGPAADAQTDGVSIGTTADGGSTA
jgi:hypothetical protein